MTRTLVVVRPEPAASETVARARDLGIAAQALPLFAVEAVQWEAPPTETYDALLLTSANALRHGGTSLLRLAQLPVLAVGTATAHAAQASGFTVERTGAGGVADLLAEAPPSHRLLYLTGHHRVELAARQSIDTIVVYENRAVTPHDLSLLTGSVIALHSPRAARHVESLVATTGLDRASIALVALSPAVAVAAGFGWRGVSAAAAPTDDALLALAAELCLEAGE